MVEAKTLYNSRNHPRKKKKKKKKGSLSLLVSRIAKTQNFTQQISKNEIESKARPNKSTRSESQAMGAKTPVSSTSNTDHWIKVVESHFGFLAPLFRINPLVKNKPRRRIRSERARDDGVPGKSTTKNRGTM